MNFTKAFAVFMQIDSKEFTEDEKYEAIQQVLDAATINSITKKQVLNVVSWLFNKQQKYRWHDLRDNPNDLPDANYPSNTWFEVVQKDNEEELIIAIPYVTAINSFKTIARKRRTLSKGKILIISRYLKKNL